MCIEIIWMQVGWRCILTYTKNKWHLFTIVTEALEQSHKHILWGKKGKKNVADTHEFEASDGRPCMNLKHFTHHTMKAKERGKEMNPAA